MGTLDGKTAIVTGAGSGLGAATARALAGAGAAVACVDICEDRARQTCEELIAQGGKSMAIGADVSREEQVQAAVDRVLREWGSLGIVVNNAAVDHTVSVEEMRIDQWDQVIDVNLRAPFLFARAAFPHMRERGDGHFVNIASTAATRAWANAAAYHASKWGLVGFGRGLGVEGRPYGIRVTTIIPGGMRTHFFDRFAEQGIPMPQEENLQDPANVAKVILLALEMPKESALQEAIVTPMTETSWP